MLRPMILLIMALVTSAAAQEVAPASSVPRLKAQALVASDLVRIGDLVDNAGALAATPIFRAPDLGQTGTVETRRIVDAALAHGMALLDTGEIGSVTVIRSSRTITRKDIEDRIARALSGQGGLGEAKDLSITFDRDVRTLHAEPSLDSALEVTRVAYDPRSGRFDTSLELSGGGSTRRLRYTGSVVETMSVVSLNRAVPRGEVLAEDDLVTDRRPKAGLGGDLIASAERAVGLAARRALRAGDPLRAGDIMKPEVVQRSEPVLIVFEAPGIVVTVRGKALESGAKGELVNVINTQTKRAVQGVVTGPGRVNITASQQYDGETTGTVPQSPARPRRRSE